MPPPLAPSATMLHERWTVSRLDHDGMPAEPTAITATVPGCIHTDLLDAGVIVDPFVDRNEVDVAWVADSDWCYRTTIRSDAIPRGRDRTELVFRGLDTLAEISIDGTEVARTENMHRTYRIDVGDLLAEPGDHELSVTFRSATVEAEGRREREGEWPAASFGRPFNYIRKMACSWGWDWGPWLTTAGIWKPASLEGWDAARLASVRPISRIDDDDQGSVTVVGTIERTGEPVGLSVEVALIGPDGADIAQTATALAPDDREFTTTLDAGPVQRWWPIGHGDQPLYTLSVRLRTSDGAPATTLGTWQRRIGFRTVELDTGVDATGSSFTFVVNDRPIFVRGVNWIPDDPFPTRVTRSRYRDRLEAAVAANVNMVRVWGGGLYEHEDFYDRCDELGVLVWQDFLFACAAYPEHLLADEVEAEACENVERLMPHPSLVLWNGNNENIWGYFDWGWRSVLAGRAWGAGFYFDVLPRVVAELDPSRPYWPGSPYSGTMAVAPNADANGCVHEWDVWNRLDHSRYRDRIPRFVSEFGWQAPPTWTTLRAAISDEPLTPSSPGMLHHQKADDGNGKLERGLAEHFAVPDDTDAWLFATRLNQARAVTTGVEHFRSLRGRCMGTIWWQLNDCWPVTSWAVVDSGGGRKPAWFALRDAYQPRLLTVQPRGDRLVAFAVNDTPAPWDVAVSAVRRQLDGTALASAATDLAVAPWSLASWVLPRRVASPVDPHAEALDVRAGARSAWWFWQVDRELRYPEPGFDVTWAASPDRNRLVATVVAHSFVRDLTVEIDRLGPALCVDRQLVTLLPGERAEFTVTSLGPEPPSLDELRAAPSAPPLWWSANDLAAPLRAAGSG